MFFETIAKFDTFQFFVGYLLMVQGEENMTTKKMDDI